jgi:hypothetical protein
MAERTEHYMVSPRTLVAHRLREPTKNLWPASVDLKCGGTRGRFEFISDPENWRRCPKCFPETVPTSHRTKGGVRLLR